MALFPKKIDNYIALVGIPQGPKSNVFLVDPVNGSDSNTGTSFKNPLKTVAAAYALCTDAQHDVVLLLSGATADTPSTAITWSKSYTHLIGLSGDLPGMGQRSRIVNTAANDLGVLFTLSGSGCIFKNIQFFDGKDSAADGAALLVSGSRNYFENVFVAGMGDGTAGAPATRAGSYSCKVTGSENYFKKCTFGLDTIQRTAANAELIVTGGRNRFDDCEFRCWSETAGKVLVQIDNSGGDMRDTIFSNPYFFCYTANWAAGINNVFDMPAAGATHWVTILGQPTVVGVSVGLADTVTHLYSAAPAPNAGYGIAIAPTT